MDFWDEVIEKAVNIEIKALLHPLSGIWEIDVKYFQKYKPAKKEDKNFEKNKSTYTLLADIPSRKQSQQSFTHQCQTDKKNKNHQKDL